MLTVICGGARSGKSSLAEEVARRVGQPVTVIATCPRIDGDDDLDRRIESHRSERPDHWTTVEEQIELARAVELAAAGTLIIDCVTLWVNNLLHVGFDDTAVDRASDRALTAVLARSGTTAVVTNEVGLGIVPADGVTRRYRDLLGRINRHWVAAADRPVFLVAGRAVPLIDPWSLLTDDQGAAR